MRKSVTLGLFALFLSTLACPLLADVSDCDDLAADASAPRGLYGLCIAYYNSANGKGQDRIAALYEKKADAAGYDPVIPGTGDETNLPDCLCWNADELIQAVAAESFARYCGTNNKYLPDEWDYFIDEDKDGNVAVSFESGIDWGSTFCRHQFTNESGVLVTGGEMENISDGEVSACRTQIREVMAAAEEDCSFIGEVTP
ncbi:hypothetical protein ACFL00_05180 [Pseudomonadota bacterium]